MDPSCSISLYLLGGEPFCLLRLCSVTGPRVVVWTVSFWVVTSPGVSLSKVGL